MANSTVLGVSQLNRYVKSLLEGDFRLRDILVRGEISNFSGPYRSGHCYFSLKEGDSAVRVVMFASYARQLPFRPENGMAVLLRAGVTLYERDGSYQLMAYDMQPEGLGSLQLAYEQLRRRLEEEGLFDLGRKRPLPPYPERIGLLTSENGAALHDMVTILGRRFPPAKLLLYPALVQGKEAPASLIRGLRWLNEQGNCDLILMGRGGGSLEDLWAFNDEKLVRAVAASETPIISAVGHETDVTLCDFAADLRAPTPSAAAELAVPDGSQLLELLEGRQEELSLRLRNRLQQARQRLEALEGREVFGPKALESQRQRLSQLEETIARQGKEDLAGRQQRLAAQSAALELLNPWAQLSRGWSLTEGEDGQRLRSVQDLEPGQRLRTRLRDGSVLSVVETIEPHKGSWEE